MTAPNPSADSPEIEQPFVTHLVELRDRLLRAVIGIGVVFLVLFPFANDLYQAISSPLLAKLPEGERMIATGVISPFLAPFKLSLVAAIFLAMPYILYQVWAFIAPGLYKHEKRVLVPMVASSTVLFYAGAAFAYSVVFPLVFAFMVATTPEGVNMAPDISQYLEFVLTLFFAFGLAFEVPIATIILVWMGVTTPKSLSEKRPYVIVGAFVFGMLLTPPDVISQTLLALPMWVLFEFGLFFSRAVYRDKLKRQQEDEQGDGNATSEASQKPSGSAANPAAAAAASGVSDDPVDSERFTPLSEEELERELDQIEAAEEDGDDYSYSDDDLGESDDEDLYTEVFEDKLRQVQVLRDEERLDEARALLREVLAGGNADQAMVAQNILDQLDDNG